MELIDEEPLFSSNIVALFLEGYELLNVFKWFLLSGIKCVLFALVYESLISF